MRPSSSTNTTDPPSYTETQSTTAEIQASSKQAQQGLWWIPLLGVLALLFIVIAWRQRKND